MTYKPFVGYRPLPKERDPNAALRRKLALQKLAQALRARIALPGEPTQGNQPLPVKPPWKR